MTDPARPTTTRSRRGLPWTGVFLLVFVGISAFSGLRLSMAPTEPPGRWVEVWSRSARTRQVVASQQGPVALEVGPDGQATLAWLDLAGQSGGRVPAGTAWDHLSLRFSGRLLAVVDSGRQILQTYLRPGPPRWERSLNYEIDGWTTTDRHILIWGRLGTAGIVELWESGGQLLWHLTDSRWVATAGVLLGEDVIIARFSPSGESELVALEPEGNTLWRLPLGTRLVTALVGNADRVAAAVPEGLQVISGTGQRLRLIRLEGQVRTVVPAGEGFAVLTGDRERRVYQVSDSGRASRLMGGRELQLQGLDEGAFIVFSQDESLLFLDGARRPDALPASAAGLAALWRDQSGRPVLLILGDQSYHLHLYRREETGP
ncbi:MAG: hypothetical protein AB1331_08755 [Bacillota bacterium]